MIQSIAVGPGNSVSPLRRDGVFRVVAAIANLSLCSSVKVLPLFFLSDLLIEYMDQPFELH